MNEHEAELVLTSAGFIVTRVPGGGWSLRREGLYTYASSAGELIAKAQAASPARPKGEVVSGRTEHGEDVLFG